MYLKAETRKVQRKSSRQFLVNFPSWVVSKWGISVGDSVLWTYQSDGRIDVRKASKAEVIAAEESVDLVLVLNDLWELPPDEEDSLENIDLSEVDIDTIDVPPIPAANLTRGGKPYTFPEDE